MVYIPVASEEYGNVSVAVEVINSVPTATGIVVEVLAQLYVTFAVNVRVGVVATSVAY